MQSDFIFGESYSFWIFLSKYKCSNVPSSNILAVSVTPNPIECEASWTIVGTHVLLPVKKIKAKQRYSEFMPIKVRFEKKFAFIYSSISRELHIHGIWQVFTTIHIHLATGKIRSHVYIGWRHPTDPDFGYIIFSWILSSFVERAWKMNPLELALHSLMVGSPFHVSQCQSHMTWPPKVFKFLLFLG